MGGRDEPKSPEPGAWPICCIIFWNAAIWSACGPAPAPALACATAGDETVGRSNCVERLRCCVCEREAIDLGSQQIDLDCKHLSASSCKLTSKSSSKSSTAALGGIFRFVVKNGPTTVFVDGAIVCGLETRTLVRFEMVFEAMVHKGAAVRPCPTQLKLQMRIGAPRDAGL